IAQGAWWSVDLGSVQHIRQINIYNRTDCCSSRLSHYLVQSSTDSTNAFDGNWPTQVDQSGAEFADGDATPIKLQVDFWARWVAVTKADSNYLSLAEVQ